VEGTDGAWCENNITSNETSGSPDDSNIVNSLKSIWIYLVVIFICLFAAGFYIWFRNSKDDDEEEEEIFNPYDDNIEM